MKKLKMLGSGCVDRKDAAIVARQVRETILRDTLKKEFNVGYSRTWKMCEARLDDLYRLVLKYDTTRETCNENLVYVAR